MPTTYVRADAEVTQLVKNVMKSHHEGLVEVGVKVCVLMASAAKDEHGEIVCPALKLHGVECAAIAKIIPYKQRAAGREDCEITIDADKWESASDPERVALIDHELCHFETSLDDEGNVKSDDMGRPKLKTRHHDHDFGWFDCIARRHGDASYEVKQAKAFADKEGQTYFGWASPPAGHTEQGPTPTVDLSNDPAFLKATRDLCPKGEGSVTISTGGKSVTLTSDTRKNIGKQIAAMGR